MQGPAGGGARDRAEAGSQRSEPRGPLRVFFANEPRAYREGIAAAFGHLRPDLDVRVVDPDVLDEEVRTAAPDVAVCSRATGVVEAAVTVWVELYPGHGARSVVSEKGRRTEFEEIRLDDLLAIVDRAAGSSGRSGG